MSTIKPDSKTRGSHLSKLQQKWIGPPKDKPWVKIYVEVMDGEAWRSLSVNERRMLDALICQHFRYYQKSNGELEISYRGFEHAGISARKYVATAKERLIALGLISVKRGVSQNPHLMPPNLYEITFYRKPKGIQESAAKSPFHNSSLGASPRFGAGSTPEETAGFPAICLLATPESRARDALFFDLSEEF